MRRIIPALASGVLAALITIGVAVTAVNSSESQAPSCLTVAEATTLLNQRYPEAPPTPPTTITCEEEWAIGLKEKADGVELFQYSELGKWSHYASGSYWGEQDDDDVCMQVPRSFLKNLAGCSS